MELFHILVISFAIVFLIIILTLIGLAMKYQDKSTVFPPSENKCPDFWTIASDNKSCVIPATGKKNVGTIYTNGNVDLKPATTIISGNVTTPYSFPVYTPGTNATITNNIQTAAASTIDFTIPDWGNQGKTDICAKKQWANNWGISWDGITNYNSC